MNCDLTDGMIYDDVDYTDSTDTDITMYLLLCVVHIFPLELTKNGYLCRKCAVHQLVKKLSM